MNEARTRGCSLGRAGFAGALLCSACAHAPPPASQTSTATAAAHATPFVSPYSYEWYVRAELLEARGEHRAAVDAYEMALSSADEDAYLLSRLAAALDLAGDADGARRALDQALALDPRSEAAWLERGRSAERHGATDQALEAYERAESGAPASADAPLALAALLRRMGQPPRALAVLERLAARNPRDSLVALRAELELARMRGDGAALERATRAWVDRHAGGLQLLRSLAAELFAAGRPALAARVLSELPEDARDPRLALELALGLMQTEQAELLLATTPPDALGGPLAIAEAYLQIGQAERALASLAQSSAEEDPHRRDLLEGLARLELGEPERAAQLLARVPPASAYRARAMRGLEQALEAAGLPALGRELGAATGAERAPDL